MIRVSTKLEELTLYEIESKMVVEARDIELVQGWSRNSEHPDVRRALKSVIHLKGAGIKYPHKPSKKKTGKFPKNNGYKKDSDKSESAGVT